MYTINNLIYVSEEKSVSVIGYVVICLGTNSGFMLESNSSSVIGLDDDEYFQTSHWTSRPDQYFWSRKLLLYQFTLVEVSRKKNPVLKTPFFNSILDRFRVWWTLKSRLVAMFKLILGTSNIRKTSINVGIHYWILFFRLIPFSSRFHPVWIPFRYNSLHDYFLTII